ncbi:RAD50-interacting protein 1 [Oopsacas minuta]|uniref:RAD50-interacting protein 1 n=1 Tax=Oopsacas minuta TaxID=111878 RepID=A0AAV7KMR9_9METZ|nr:RAD50-interacting protein 1 [Oopsacas minuta]
MDLANIWDKLSMDLQNISEFRNDLIEKRELLLRQSENSTKTSVNILQENPEKFPKDIIIINKSETETLEIPVSIFEKYKQTIQLENLLKYLQIYSQINKESELHKKCIETQNIEKAIETLEKNQENISNLKKLEINWVEAEDRILKIFSDCIETTWTQVSVKFNHMSNHLNWPFHNEQTETTDKTKFIHLAINYSYLTHIHYISKSVNKIVYSPPISLLTTTLNKRFVYHFRGDKESNNLEKPEWCFKQILKWIEINSKVIESELIEIIAEKASKNYTNILRDFIAELCKFAVEKVEDSLIQIEELPVSYGVKVFSHWVDEILDFEDSLEEIGFIPEKGVKSSVIEVLQNERNIPKMLEMEQNISDIIQNNFHKNLDTFDKEWAINLLVEIKAMKSRGERICHQNYQVQTVGIIQDFLNEVSQKVREKFTEIHVWKISMDRVVVLLNGVTILIENMQRMQEEAFFLKIASKTKSQDNQSQIFDDVIMNFSCLQNQIVQSIQTYATTLIINSANEYTSLEWIKHLPPIDDVISFDIPKSFFHLLDNLNSIMERIVNINTTIRTQILLCSFGDLDKYLFESIFLDKFPNSNLFTNISFHIQKYLFTFDAKTVNNTFPRLQDVINIFSKTEVELSLILRDINQQSDWSSSKKSRQKLIDINKKFRILFLDTEDIKYLVSKRMNQLSIII